MISFSVMMGSTASQTTMYVTELRIVRMDLMNTLPTVQRVRKCLQGANYSRLRKCLYAGCENDEFQCLNGYCIPDYYICDGYEDCEDGSDEHIANCSGSEKMSSLL